MTSLVRPVEHRRGYPVPFIAPWSGEEPQAQPLTRGPNGLAFTDEHYIDRDCGVLWMRIPVLPRRGKPVLSDVHGLRQRQAMTRLLCQMCGGPTVGSRSDGRTLFLLGSAKGRPVREEEVTASPPVHAACARLAVEYCPHLRFRGWAAALVERTPVWGVAGPLYAPETLAAVPPLSADGLHRVPFTDGERLRWVLASRLMISLEGVQAVTDLDELVDEIPRSAVNTGSR